MAGSALLSAQWQGHVLPHHPDCDSIPTAAALLFEHGPHSQFEGNRLVIQIQPAEGIQLHFQTKVPDAGMHLRLTDLDFRFQITLPRSCPMRISDCCSTR